MKPTAYIINLDRRPDRWETCQRVWSPYFELMRIPAIDRPDNPALGCKLSHFRIASQAVLLSTKMKPVIEMAIVLEDDSVPTPAFEQIGLKCIEDAGKHINEWRIANLGPYLNVDCLGLGRANLQATKSEYFLSASYCQQTHAMLYNERTIPLLQMALRSSLPLDVFIGRAVNDVWVPIHLLATQSDSPSDIPKPVCDAKALYALSEKMLEDAVNKAKV